ncbi:HAD family hydrolase [Paenibacillus harenae]|uniref:FMN phosphatase YigB (HAD superfamily) n=1 Tax=Paenibacillus harenae TaxID=306543 RepID=A0ABT9U959_PAEHA|nr:HAD family hydrolase [Paenibacillus harenae]MDQ0116179.1 FMN phosphatase YigB (HAD superfamily) [Paenibacillus harenae]
MFNEDWLSAVKVIIFDMDGTLYQEDTYLERFIRYLLKGTEHERDTEAAIRLGRAILTGEHPFQFGHFYHTRDDVALLRHEDSFNQGFTWDGLALDERTRTYRSLSSEAAHLIHIGDPWGIAAVVSHKYKLPAGKLQSAFKRVRREMVVAPYHFEFRSDLFQAIEDLDAVEKKILMTNTYLESGIEFLNYMQIHHLFDEVYCGAEKPLGLRSYFSTLLEQGYQAHEILSIGDNTWNDLHPVKRMGGRTCFISPYSSSDPEKWDLRLTTLDELKQLMREMQESITRRTLSDGENRAQKYKQEIQR